MSDGQLNCDYTDIGDAKKEPPAWVIENLLIRGLTIIGSPPKAGKSTWTMMMAALIAEWHCKALPSFLSKVKQPGPTLVFSAEADAGELRYCMEEGLHVDTKADGSIMIVDDCSDIMLDDASSAKRLLSDIKTLDPRLVVLDPLRDFHVQSENDASKVITLLKPYRDWAKRNDAAFIVCHHTNKPPALERDKWRFRPSDLRGSGALFGKADGVMMLTPLDENNPCKVHAQCIFKRAKGWESDIHLAAWAEGLDRGRELFTDLDNNVLRGLKNGLQPNAIAAQLHITDDMLKNTLAKLERNGAIHIGAAETKKGKRR